MKKRIISLLLAIGMMVSSFSIDANAATKTNFPDLKANEAQNIQDVFITGIMQGDEFGFFNPDSYLTKAEACAMTTRMKGIKNSYLYSVGNFKDVPAGHWASQIIGLAVNEGLAVGDGNGYFNPDKTLNGMELITMCLRVEGIGQALDETNNWPSAHMQFVNNESILSGYNTSVFEPITRLEAARIVSQFLNAPVWKRNARTGQYEITEDTILKKYFNMNIYNDVIITEIEVDDRRIEGLYKDENGEYTKTIRYLYLPSNYNMDDFEVGDIVSFSLNDNMIMKIEKDDFATNRVIFYQDIVDYDSAEGYIKFKVDGKSNKYLLSEDLLIVNVNGETETGTTNNMASTKRKIESTITNGIDADTKFRDVSGRIILNESNKIISITIAAYDKILYVKKNDNGKITGYSASDYNSVHDKTLTSINLKNNDYEIRNTKGRELDYDDIEKGDYLLIANNEEPYSILKLDETIYGEVKEVEKSEDNKLIDENVKINGVTYNFNTSFCEKFEEADDIDDMVHSNYTLYLDQNGLIVGYVKEK
ncbi:MAG: S-layer homology domain-containing protein [Clostridia bacterium]|nr:S-layer homology domain-containing protein [Clostridia bacterium]